MHRLALACLLAATACATGCATTGTSGTADAAQPSATERAAALARGVHLAPALAALEAGDLARAEALLADPGDGGPEALGLRALVTWLIAQRDLAEDARTALLGGAVGGTINERHAFAALDHALEGLDRVDADLAAAQAGGFTLLEVTPARWRVDVDADGSVDEADARLLQVEVDRSGRPLPEGDPRRTPTFLLDRGDVAWARAMVAYQRALLSGLRAYHWGDLAFALRPDRDVTRVVIRLADPTRVHRAAALIAEGVRHARHARLEYLAETDDDREWVPSPTQTSHAVPLPVDAALYEAWLGILDDSDRLLTGAEGLDLAALAALVDRDLAARIHGFFDVHAMLSAPGPITLDLRLLGDARSDPQAALRSLLGGAWREVMKPSPLGTRAQKMQREVEAGLEPWTQKLKYLLWLN